MGNAVVVGDGPGTTSTREIPPLLLVESRPEDSLLTGILSILWRIESISLVLQQLALFMIGPEEVLQILRSINSL